MKPAFNTKKTWLVEYLDLYKQDANMTTYEVIDFLNNCPDRKKAAFEYFEDYFRYAADREFDDNN